MKLKSWQKTAIAGVAGLGVGYAADMALEIASRRLKDQVGPVPAFSFGGGFVLGRMAHQVGLSRPRKDDVQKQAPAEAVDIDVTAESDPAEEVTSSAIH